MTTGTVIPSGLVVAPFTCRDIGYGVETGEVVLPAIGGPDWTGKRPYRLHPDGWAPAPGGTTVFLFPDELDESNAVYLCPHGCPLVIWLDDVAAHQAWHEGR